MPLRLLFLCGRLVLGSLALAHVIMPLLAFLLGLGASLGASGFAHAFKPRQLNYCSGGGTSASKRSVSSINSCSTASISDKIVLPFFLSALILSLSDSISISQRRLSNKSSRCLSSVSISMVISSLCRVNRLRKRRRPCEHRR